MCFLLMENRLLDQFNNTIITQWLSNEISIEYKPLNHRELFEIAYHTCNSVGMRNIYIKLSQDEEQNGYCFDCLYDTKNNVTEVYDF